jgi:hypothetical protein
MTGGGAAVAVVAAAASTPSIAAVVVAAVAVAAISLAVMGTTVGWDETWEYLRESLVSRKVAFSEAPKQRKQGRNNSPLKKGKKKKTQKKH